LAPLPAPQLRFGSCATLDIQGCHTVLTFISVILFAQA
jgi:hypothetical protein